MTKAASSSLLFAREISRERQMADHIPYLRHVDEQTIRTKEGMFLQVIKVAGFCHDTADQTEIDQKASMRNIALRALGDSRYAIYSHIVRRRVSPLIGGSFDEGFAEVVNQRYMAGLVDKRMYANDLYLTILRKGFQGRIGWADNVLSMFRRSAGLSVKEMEREARIELTQHVANIAKDLEQYGAEILGCEQRLDAGDQVFSRPLEFLTQLLNGGQAEPVRLPRQPLDEYLPSRRITFGKRSFEIRGATLVRFGAILGVREYSDTTYAGMLDGLLKIPGEFVLTQSFAIHDRSEALAHLELVHRQLKTSDEKGSVAEDSINAARNQIVGGKAVNGSYHLTLTALGDTIREMELCLQEANKTIQNQGMVAVREDLNAECAFWAQLPGNFAYIARKPTISSANFVGLASLHNFALGKPDGNHWGPALSLLQSTSSTPYYLNLHSGDLGSFTVVGQSGSGKTVMLNFLIMQAMRVEPRPRIAFFDKDRAGEVAIRALGGRYETLEPGARTGFNFLQVEDTSHDREFVLNMLRFLVRPSNERDLTVAQERILGKAVEEIFKVEREKRLLSDVAMLLRGEERASDDDLSSRLEVWLHSRGWLFNNPTDSWEADTGIFGFDMTKILDDADIRTAALGYIFHRIESMLIGKRPMMMFIDEGWKILDDSKFSGFLNDKLKTIRKLNGLVGFGTQSAKDIVNSKMAHTLLEQTAVNIFFPAPKPDRESYRKGFHLSDVEIEWLATTPKEARQFLIKKAHDSVVVRLDLSHMLDIVHVLSGNPDTARECERLRAAYGDAPANWLKYFCAWEQEPSR